MCAPKPPNPYNTASAQTGQNISTAEANSWLNNVNKHGPDGNVDFNQTGSQKVWDPNLNGEKKGGYRQVPTFTQTTTLSDAGQRIKGLNDQAQTNLAQTASERSNFLRQYLSKPAQYTDTTHTNWATGLYDKVNQPGVTQAKDALESRLASQGIQIGSPAYDQQMQNFQTGAQHNRDQFALDSYGQGRETFFENRNQPLNEVIGLLNGSQIQRPGPVQTAQSNIPTTDLAGLIQDNYQQKLAKHQALMGGIGQLGSGIFGLFGGL